MKTKPFLQNYLRHRPTGIRHARAAQTSYAPDQVSQLYSWPVLAHFAGPDPVIAIGELGGGWNQADLDKYFAARGLDGLAPDITDVSVRGAVNSPTGDPNGPDGEVMLDIYNAAAPYTRATGRKAKVVMFWAPNDATGIPDATMAAANHPSKPCVMSWSWGGPEDSWDPSSIAAGEAAFQFAASVGMTVTASSGDNGSGDGERGNHVDYPASSPWVLACGGTSLPGGDISRESVWNDGSQGGSTGGGVSTLFQTPAYQNGFLPAGVKGRGVPDVAGNADPETGYSELIDGVQSIIGGTSAVSPLMASLIALLCAATGRRFGLINPLFYGAWATAFRDIVSGNNGGFAAGVGYDFDTGIGVPIGTKVLAAIQGGAPPVVNPPAPPPTALFAFNLKKAIPKGGTLDVRGVLVTMAPGKYTVSKAA